MKPGLIFWGARLVLRHGFPRRVILGYRGLGDELMAAGALRELSRRRLARGNWFLAFYPELWGSTRFTGSVIPRDPRVVRLAERLGRPVICLSYMDYDEINDRETPLPAHAITSFCSQLGIRGQIELKPQIELTAAERKRGRRFARQVVLHSSSGAAALPIPLKSWPWERWNRVAAALRADGFDVIQVGSTQDPKIQDAVDLRGQTTIRETAAILAESLLFVGLVGGLMHLARAVECPSVIVYGGRETLGLAGYSANTNLVLTPPCAPCHFRYRCPHDIVCMTGISDAQVVAAAKKRLAQPAENVPIETAFIP